MGGPYLIWNYFYTVILYSFQKSARVTAHMFGAVATATRLAAHTVLLEGWETAWGCLPLPPVEPADGLPRVHRSL